MEVVWEVVGERSGDAARHGASAEGSAEGGRGGLARGRPDSESVCSHVSEAGPPKWRSVRARLDSFLSAENLC